MIIAVDFDGTLCKHAFPEIGFPNEELIRELIFARERGDQLILWTCRGNTHMGNHLDRAVEFCRGEGLEFDAVNDNLPDIVEEFGYNGRKILANMYIEDRGMLPREAADALLRARWKAEGS